MSLEAAHWYTQLMLATVNSSALIGVDAHPVQVKVNTGEVGEPRIFMVGLKSLK